jgi:hypothetical protein
MQKQDIGNLDNNNKNSKACWTLLLQMYKSKDMTKKHYLTSNLHLIENI